MDILDSVDLTLEAVELYQAFTEQVAVVLYDITDLRPEELPEEEALEQPDGSLLIFVDLPREQGRVEFVIPPGQWLWRNRN